MFGKSYQPIRDKVLRVAHRLLGSKDEAEDIAQDVLLKLYQRDDLAKLSNVEAYAVTMAKNLCFDIKRKQVKMRMVELDSSTPFFDQHTPESSMVGAEGYQLIMRAMDLLSDTYKMVVHLRDVEEMEFDQIALVMEMTENQVRVTLSRARKKLRESLLNEKNLGYETSRGTSK